jgi:hypothetical protein
VECRKSTTATPLQQWGLHLHKLRGHNKATVALANKLARRVCPSGNDIVITKLTIRAPEPESELPFS